MLLEYMRKNTKRFLYAIVPLIVVSFVLWGTVSDPGDRRPEETMIEIGEDKVSNQEFLNRYYGLRQRMQENFGGELTPEIEEMLNLKQQALDDLIRENLLGREVERLKLVASDREVQDSLKRYPEFQTDGRFDATKWNVAIGNPGIPWGTVMEQERRSLNMQKLMNLIQSAARVTEEEVRDEFRRQNEKVAIEFASLRTSEFGGDEEMSDEEIASFYDEHKEEYAVPAKVKLSYVKIEKVPSQLDHEDALEHCNGILERVRAGDDFAELAEYYSDDAATKAKGGDLGFFRKGRMARQYGKEFEDTAFSLAPGQISDVIKAKSGYHIIKVEETRGDGEEKEVSVQHVLVKAEPSEDTLIDLKEKTMLLARDAETSTLKESAEANGLTLLTTPAFSENSSVVPGIGLVSEITEILPGLREGKSSDVIEGDKAFYLIEVAERMPERIRELSEVEARVKAAAGAEKALGLAKTRVEEIVAEINENGVALADVEGIPEPQQTEPFTRRGYAPELPPVGGLTNAVFELADGEAAGPFVAGGFVYVVVSKGMTEADPEEYETQKDSIKERILSQRGQQIFSDYYENLRDSAGVRIDEDLLEDA